MNNDKTVTLRAFSGGLGYPSKFPPLKCSYIVTRDDWVVSHGTFSNKAVHITESTRHPGINIWKEADGADLAVMFIEDDPTIDRLIMFIEDDPTIDRLKMLLFTIFAFCAVGISLFQNHILLLAGVIVWIGWVTMQAWDHKNIKRTSNVMRKGPEHSNSHEFHPFPGRSVVYY